MPPAAVGAVMAMQAIMQARQQNAQAGVAQRFAAKNRRQSLGYASPENYLNTYKQYLNQFQGEYAPEALNIGQDVASGSQAAGQNIATQLGRRGLSGSGIDFALQNANQASRQANYSQALRDFYNRSQQAAMGQAAETVGRQTGTSVQVPNQYYPQMGLGMMGTNALGAFASGYTGAGGGSASKLYGAPTGFGDPNLINPSNQASTGLYLGYRPGKG